MVSRMARESASESVDQESTALAVLTAAERLIGERGVDLVSLRSISAAVGANVAVVHYYYRSKEGLVSAILSRRMEALGAERLAALSAVEAMPAPPIRAVAEVMVVPLARFAETEQGLAYVRFLAALQRSAEPWWSLVMEAFALQRPRVDAVVDRAMLHLTPPVKAFRRSVYLTLILDLLATPERHFPELTGEARVSAIVDVLTGVLEGSHTPNHTEETT